MYGIDTVLKFVETDEEWIKENLGVNGTRTQMELKGIPKIKMEEKPEAQKSIITSRSFRKPVTTLEGLQEAVATFISRATEKLRQQQCVASYVQVYISTGYHQKGEHYRNHFGMELPYPTAATPEFIAIGKNCLKKIFRWGFGYKKAGVVITGIVPKRYQQFDLFTPHENHEKQEAIMKIIDHANWRWGTDTLKYGATGIKRSWGYRQEKRSPNYTTRWDELFTITI
jgi:DNA polymerase V